MRFADAVRAGRVPAFHILIAESHPLFGAPKVQHALARSGGSGSAPVVLALSPEDAGVSGEVIADFYAITRAMADYLIARSGDERILARIATLIAEQHDALAWLDNLCADGTLPVAAEVIDSDFAAWAAARADEQGG